MRKGTKSDASLAAAAQVENGINIVRRINVLTGAVSTLAGSAGRSGHADGVGTAATFRTPLSVSVDVSGTVLLVVR